VKTRAVDSAAVHLPRPRGEWFSRDGHARFGWIHEPAAETARDIALVIVPPFGYEAICAHRSLRRLAESAALAGLHAIRFDLDGTGDSAGDDLEPDRLGAWVASVADACDLARSLGPTSIVLAGVRLGATLAALAAAKRDDVAGLVAIAAVASGKALVREARALQMAVGLEEPPPGATASPADAHELIGFALTAETRTALSAVDLVGAAHAPAPAVIVIDRDDMAPNDKWVAALRAKGAAVEHVRLPGYVEMMLDPHRAVVPEKIVEATVAFAAARASRLPGATGATAATPTTAHVPAAATRPSTAAVTLSMRSEPARGVTEDLVRLDDDLVGIASRGTHTSGRAVILLNSGSIHRVGPNRLYVALARRLAARGDLVLRVDLAGIGDSRPRGAQPDNIVYSPTAIDDVAAAVAWCKRQDARTVTVVGLCSGAYHALKAAVAGQPIDAIVPINPLTFFWKPGMPLDFAAFKDAARYQKSVTSVQSWKKLLSGKVDVRRVAKVAASRARSILEHRARDLARELRLPLTDDLASELAALGRRGTRMHFIFSASDPGRAMLLEQGGTTVERLRKSGKLAIDVIDRTDHTFTARWAHPRLLDAITAAVSR
jgi:pimeloyl-ACP methyl ester carboxylesterase